jgi:hypothetical protein
MGIELKEKKFKKEKIIAYKVKKNYKIIRNN